MGARARKPAQPTRTMVLGLFLVPWSAWTLILAGAYAGTTHGLVYLLDGALGFIAGFLVLANLMAGRWLATLWSVIRVLLGGYILVLTLGFRGTIGPEWITYGTTAGLITLGVGVLATWMAFPRPDEQEAYREGVAAVREEKAAQKAATEGI
jgi:hypothetical protein